MANTSFEMERDDGRDSVNCESEPQDVGSYQNVTGLNEDRKPQNPIQDNMENYRKLLSLGVQLAEDDRHTHMTQGHSSRSKRSAYPSTSRGLKTMPEAKKLAHRRGICEDESSHGVIMEKFIKDVSRGSRSRRAREPNDWPPRFPGMADDNWKNVSFNRRESVIQERGCEGNAFRGGLKFSSNLVSRRRILERKRHYPFDTDRKSSVSDHKGCAKKKPFECNSEMRKSMNMSGLSGLGSPSLSVSQPSDLGEVPYVCDECGRWFTVVSEFVEHQIMHTRENLFEYGESFLHSVTISEVQESQVGGKHFECKECGETFNKSAALAEHRKIHARKYLAECKGQKNEGAVIASPTFSELKKMYGKDKFYECRVCKETFLHSSALIKHQKIHIGGNFVDDKDSECGYARDYEHRESFTPSSAFYEFQKMCGKEKIYECNVCGETFFLRSSLREHQKIHIRGSPFENESRLREETFIPRQSLNRRQKTFPKEKFFMKSSDISEHQKNHSRKNFFEGRGYEKSMIHGVPFIESQKSHTITRPPENEEDDKAFTISTNPDQNQKFAPTENVFEEKQYGRPALHSLASAEAQKSQSKVGLGKPKAETIIQSSDMINRHRVSSGENSCEEKEYKKSVKHNLAAPRPLKRRSGNGQFECDGEGESSVYISDLSNKRQKISTRVSPYEAGKSNNYEDSVVESVACAEPQTSLARKRSGEFKQDDMFSVPSSDVPKHQKARAKKKYIEQRGSKTSVAPSLPLIELQKVHPREKLYECQECGESFGCSSDLTEHQKIHKRKKRFGSRNYEQSVTHSLAPADPQTGHAQERYSEEQALSKSSEIRPCLATSSSVGAHQENCAQEKTYSEETHCQELLGQKTFDETLGQEPHSQDTLDQETWGKEIVSQEAYSRKTFDQETCNKETVGQDSHSWDTLGQEMCDKETVNYDPRVCQEIYDKETVAQEPHGGKTVGQKPLDEETRGQDPCGKESHGMETIDQEPLGGETLGQENHGQETVEGPVVQGSDLDDFDDTIYKCEDCGLSFVDLTDFTGHQDFLNRRCIVDSHEYTYPVAHTYSVSEYEKKYTGEQLYECLRCGESFIHSSFLFEHQRIHEQDQLCAVKGCDDDFIPLLPVKFHRDHAVERNPEFSGSAIQCCQYEGFIHSSAVSDHMRYHRDDKLLEHSEVPEEIFYEGFALTEFQGSETGEKLFECTICGECYFSAKELGNHTKFHNDESYEYGPSYSHTSFLTDHLQRPTPLFECKDCGPTFMHDTVFSKQKMFYLEEEAAAATFQEVEANVLVPHEVLKIQGSHVEAAKPEVEAEGPEKEVAEPSGEAEQPNGDADEPDGSGIEDPEERAKEPEGRAEKPEGDADEPDGAGIEDPEEEGAIEEMLVEESYYSCQECTETFTSSEAFGDHLKSHASMIIFEPANILGEFSGYIQGTSTSAGDPADQADEKYFKCAICGQLFSNHLSLAGHQNSHFD
ncbi:paternally-expressed gene 3 protein [Ctenodactylus gundi]